MIAEEQAFFRTAYLRRKQLGFSVADVARLVADQGVPMATTTYQRLEFLRHGRPVPDRQRSRVHLGEALAIARALSFSIEEAIYGQD